METSSFNSNSHQDFKKIFEFDENVVVKQKEDKIISDKKNNFSDKKVDEKKDDSKEDPFFFV